MTIGSNINLIFWAFGRVIDWCLNNILLVLLIFGLYFLYRHNKNKKKYNGV